jgi:hypothetical protein
MPETVLVQWESKDRPQNRRRHQAVHEPEGDFFGGRRMKAMNAASSFRMTSPATISA